MKFFNVILFLFLLLTSVAAQPDLKIKTGLPDYIAQYEKFSASTIMRIDMGNIDSLHFYFDVPTSLSLDSLNCNCPDTSGKLSVLPFEEGFYTNTYLSTIADSALLSGTSFQVVHNYSVVRPEDGYISYRIDYFIADSVVTSYSSDENEFSEYYVQETVFSFYDDKTSGGNSLQMNEDGSLKIKLKEDPENNLFVEFWAKFEDPEGVLLAFYNDADDTIFTMSANKYRLVMFDSGVLPDEYHEYYLSPSAWYYYNIVLNKKNMTLSLFINDTLVNENRLDESVSLENYTIAFTNSSKEMHLDRLKLWDFNDTREWASRNKNYAEYYPDNSKLLLNLQFDVESTDKISTENILVENCRIDISDVPLYTRAPELNVKVYAGFSSLEWSTSDEVNVQSFEVEKSSDGSSYSTLYKVDATEGKMVYNFDEPRSEKDGVAYYRIRQNNIDSTYIYSTEVKVGHGKLMLISEAQNYPNPFNPLTTISFELLESVEIEINVYDITGEKVKKIHEGFLNKGVHTFQFDGSNLPSGIYLYEIKSPMSSQVQKMILAK